MTGIEWTTRTWNPATGCDRVSPGCDHCYALEMAKRLKAMGQPKYQADGGPRTSGPGFGVSIHPDGLGLPLRTRKPATWFVNSMGDLFHEKVPDGFIAQVWDVMGRTPWHTYQILTKRHARMRSWVRRWADRSGDSGRREEGSGMPPMPRGPEAVRAVYESGRALLFADMLDSMGTPPEGCAYPLYDWMEGQRRWPEVLPNVWLGVSAEDDPWARIRLPALRQTPAAVRFVSAEPLLGPIDMAGRLAGIGWVIAGGESGRCARPCDLAWVRSLRDQCSAAGVPFFCKQLGSVLGREFGAGPKGGDIDAFPEDLRVREFPRGWWPVTA